MHLTSHSGQGEFNLQPDEPGQFVTGLAARDFVWSWRSGSPIEWAGQYYVHYPRVAIGRWPPGYAAIQAVWWSILPPARWSGLLLNSVIALTAGILFFLLLRRLVPDWAAVPGSILLLAAVPTANSYTEIMADIPGLLLTVLLIGALARFLEEPGLRRFWPIAVLLVCGLTIKGTAVYLILSPALGLLLSERARAWRMPALVAAPALAAAWFVMTTWLADWPLVQLVFRLGGIGNSGIPWPVWIISLVVGWPLFLIALVAAGAAPLRPRPEVIASAAILISAMTVAWFARAMLEPRHWMVVAPAVLLLAVEFLWWLRLRWHPAFAVVLLIAGLVWYPWGVNRQRPSGFRDLVRTLKLPSRVFVSSNTAFDGSAIAEIAAADPYRPGSTIIRASKLLASMDWNGQDYRLLVKTPEQTAVALDEVAADVVWVHVQPGVSLRADQDLLLAAVRNPNGSWKACGHSIDVDAFCRTRPPAVPRKPIVIDLRHQLPGLVIREKS